VWLWDEREEVEESKTTILLLMKPESTLFKVASSVPGKVNK